MARQRREVWYEGHVQGVGFRYTVTNLARQYDVSGFVRNLPDGRVHLVCEGEQAETERLLADVQRELGGHVRRTQQDRRPATGEFSGFETRY